MRLAALLGMALTGLSWTHLSVAFFVALLIAASAGGVPAVTERLDDDRHILLGPILIAGLLTVLHWPATCPAAQLKGGTAGLL